MHKLVILSCPVTRLLSQGRVNPTRKRTLTTDYTRMRIALASFRLIYFIYWFALAFFTFFYFGFLTVPFHLFQTFTTMSYHWHVLQYRSIDIHYNVISLTLITMSLHWHSLQCHIIDMHYNITTLTLFTMSFHWHSIKRHSINRNCILLTFIKMSSLTLIISLTFTTIPLIVMSFHWHPLQCRYNVILLTSVTMSSHQHDISFIALTSITMSFHWHSL